MAVDGSLDWAAWIERMLAEHPQLAEQPLIDCCAWIDREHRQQLAMALELGELVAQLRLDTASVVAALVRGQAGTSREDHAFRVSGAGWGMRLALSKLLEATQKERAPTSEFPPSTLLC